MYLPTLVYKWGECISVPRKGSSIVLYFLSKKSVFCHVTVKCLFYLSNSFLRLLECPKGL